MELKVTLKSRPIFFVCLGFYFASATFLVAETKSVPAGFFDRMQYSLAYKKAIPAGKNGWSGITYNPKTKSLFVVDDKAILIELSKAGDLRRSIPLVDFEDVEGIAYVSGNQMALTEEGRGTIILIRTSPETSQIFRKGSEVFEIEPNLGNTGLVGVAYAPSTDMFYALKERNPKKVYTIKLKGPMVSVFKPFDGELLPVKDLNDIALNPSQTSNFLFLSNKSKRLLEVNPVGEVVSSLSLMSVIYNGQPQGFTFDDQGRLYVVTELGDENLYCFAPEIKPAK